MLPFSTLHKIWIFEDWDLAANLSPKRVGNSVKVPWVNDWMASYCWFYCNKILVYEANMKIVRKELAETSNIISYGCSVVSSLSQLAGLGFWKI